MATHRYNGHKHHSRKHHSSEQLNRRRLSKQEEIDLTVETIDSNDKCNNYINGEPTLAPTIHVNSVEDKVGHKSITEREDKSRETFDSIENCNPSVVRSDSDLEKCFADKLNVNQSNSLSNEDHREKKRGKHLARAEAVRDTSASPPPAQYSDSEERSSHTLTVNSSNSQSQTGVSNSCHKNKIKAQGSNGSLDRSSPCLSRDSSTENYSDLNGTDVQQFLMETLQKNKKDRVFLLKIEQDLNGLVKDNQKTTYKFAQMTSYNRMLVHRVAALFGFEHNVDVLGTSVVVNKCKTTRIPDMKFKDCIKEDSLHEPKKSILKRDSASLEDGSNSSSVSFDGKEKSPDRQNGNICDSNRSKSFEEREERYEKARARIFNQDSSSSTEGNDGNCNPIPDQNGYNLIQRNSSPRSSQSNEDIPTKANIATEVRNWSSTDSDSSGLHRNESKSMPQNIQSKSGNCLDSDQTPKPTPLSPSSSCGRVNQLAPNTSLSVNTDCTQHKSRPTVTKASSFGGISRNMDNASNSTQTNISKSGSFNVSQNLIHGQSGANAINPNRSHTPKNSFRQESAHKSVANNSISHQSEQRYVSSQQTSVHSSTASHHNRHNWHQNSHSRNNNNNNREPSFANSVQWPQNYPHFIYQNDSNLNQLKDSHYLQSGQQIYLSSVPTYGPTVTNEPPQHLTQTPIRLIYPNPNQPQMRPNVNHLINSSVTHQNVSNQMSSVPFQLQSSPSALNFSGNQSNIQNNPMISGSLSRSYGAPLQMPSNVGNVGTVWIIGNGVNPQSNSPMMTCPPPPNTPPSASIGSNIAPFVGMSYQHYRPTINSNPNLSVSAAQNRGTAPLLKSQPLLATQANNQRILTSNGNHFVQHQMPDVVDMNNLMGANNYMNRGSVAPQMNHLRRMPANSNQGLDVRLVGPQASTPFLLPTPQRPYFPVTVNHRSFYANNANNVNQRSKHSFSKNKSQNNRYNNNANHRNILVPNSNTNCSNT